MNRRTFVNAILSGLSALTAVRLKAAPEAAATTRLAAATSPDICIRIAAQKLACFCLLRRNTNCLISGQLRFGVYADLRVRSHIGRKPLCIP